MNLIYSVADFIEQGGSVLWLLFAACLLLWMFILERVWFLRITWPRRARELKRAWDAREDRQSWQARKIR